MPDTHGFAVRRAVARTVLRLARWRTTGEVPVQGIVVVQIPAGDAPPGANAALTVRRIANTLGFTLQPGPTTTQLP